MKTKKFLAIPVLAVCVLAISASQVLAQEDVSIFTELSEFMEKYEQKCPEAAAGFYILHDTIVNREGKISNKTKEFIALGIAVSQRCKYCIYFHTASAMKYGATEEEILEAASVAVYMGGGPAFVYIKYVIDAMEELAAMKESQEAEK